jgi:hypothetical protein
MRQVVIDVAVVTLRRGTAQGFADAGEDGFALIGGIHFFASGLRLRQ